MSRETEQRGEKSIGAPAIIEQPRAAPTIEIQVPQNFSLVRHTEQVLQFFIDLASACRSGSTLSLDFRELQYVSIDSLLVLNSVVQRLRPELGKDPFVHFLPPKNTKAKRHLRNSGFYTYVEGYPGDPGDDGTLEIVDHNSVDVVINSRLQDFVRSRLTRTNEFDQALDRKLRDSYGILTECMSNTYHHAKGLGPEESATNLLYCLNT